MDRAGEPASEAAGAEVVQAITANWAAFYRHLGRGAGVELADGEHLSWMLTGIPDAFLNVVFRTDVPPDRAEEVVDRALAHFRSSRIPVLSWLTPGHAIGSLLGRRGLTFERGPTAMAADLEVVPERVPAPPGLAIVEVADRASAESWVRVMAVGFGTPEDGQPRLLEVFAAADLAPPMSTYLALLDGRAVATSQLFLDGGVAGIYSVTCLPEARGQGIGAAVTFAALLAARRAGIRLAVLQASDLGYSVYRRLGFRDYGRIDEYRFTLDDHSTAG
jgi:ribosomal protein S18 acetylase RimI-like enzyme